MNKEGQIAALNSRISELEINLQGAMKTKKELIKQKTEMQTFQESFESQFNACKTSLMAIGDKFPQIDYATSSTDTTLNNLFSINDSVREGINNNLTKMDTTKEKIGEKVTLKREEIDGKILEVDGAIEALNAEINSCKQELSLLSA